MPLQAFSKLFPKWIRKGLPTGLWKCKTRLTAYNGTNIPQLGALDTKITWKDQDTKKMTSMNTTWYVADTPGPAILGLPSCSRLGIVHLNCAVEFCKYGKPIKQDHNHQTGGRGGVGTHSSVEVQQDLRKQKSHTGVDGRVGTHTSPMAKHKPIKSREDLIKAYPDRFEGIGKFPGHTISHSRRMPYQLYTHPGSAL